MTIELDSSEASDLIEALDTYLTERTTVLTRTDTAEGRHALHASLDRLERVRNRLRTVASLGLESPAPL